MSLWFSCSVKKQKLHEEIANLPNEWWNAWWREKHHQQHLNRSIWEYILNYQQFELKIRKQLDLQAQFKQTLDHDDPLEKSVDLFFSHRLSAILPRLIYQINPLLSSCLDIIFSLSLWNPSSDWIQSSENHQQFILYLFKIRFISPFPSSIKPCFIFVPIYPQMNVLPCKMEIEIGTKISSHFHTICTSHQHISGW